MNSRARRVALWSVPLLLGCASFSPAQNFTGGYSFALPPQDTTTQTFLPAFPARPIAPQDFIGVGLDGHFSLNDAPVRFFGTNCVADGAVPAKTKASFIAGRLRKMGFNLIRFHHLDNPWSTLSLLYGTGDTRHLNLYALDRLEFFIAELKKNGVYVNMNLHVARTFRTADGVTAADSLPEFGKGVTIFDPRLIWLQQEYASQLLTHVNPYTGLSMVNDPAIAMIEVTNENSLFRFWRDGLLMPIPLGGVLSFYHDAMLDSLWHAYLAAAYGSTTALAAAWNPGLQPADTVSQVRNGSYENGGIVAGWTLEQHSPAAAAAFLDSTTASSGSYSARVEVTQSDGVDWHVQWKQMGLRIIKDSVYTVRFAARGDVARTFSLTLQKESSPWTGYGWMSFALSTSWKQYTYTFKAGTSDPLDTRLTFSIGAQAGTTWFDDVVMVREGTGGLGPAENLEEGTVRRIGYAECLAYTDGRIRDITGFYLRLQNDYFDRMREYLKNVLHVRVPIVGTNWNFGLPDRASQARMDYIDNHAYWDHPSFPGVPWSATDWTIANQPMVRSTNGGAIAGLMAGVGVKGKPFTVSEYNHAFPNRYQSEGILFLSAYAAFQGADGFMLFDYSGAADDWETDRVNGYFDIHRNTAMMSLIPASASAFRGGLVAPSSQPVTLRFDRDDVLLSPRKDGGGAQLYPPTLALLHAVRAETYEAVVPADLTALQTPPAAPYVTDTGEITWNTDGLFSVATPRFVGAAGFLSSSINTRIGDVVIHAASPPGAFAALAWVSLTDRPLAQSRLSHVTVSTMLQNTGMAWDGTSTVHDNWGSPPTLICPILLIGRFHVAADSIRVHPLGTSGEVASPGTVYAPSDTNTFTVVFNQPTPWYGIEAFGGGVTSTGSRPGEGVPERYGLFQNYPNPFNPVTAISYRLPVVSRVRLVVYDVLGREVARLVDGRQMPGEHTVSWDGGGSASGVFFCRLLATAESGRTSAPAFEQTIKMLLVR